MIHIVAGNTKIGNTPNISFPPATVCVNSKYCKDTCYAAKFYRLYQVVRTAWDENLREYISDQDYYFDSIRRYLISVRPKYFRWHVSGDIPDQRYLDSMIEIAHDYYYTRFLAFTKNYKLNFGELPGNLSIILSAWPGLRLPSKKLPIAFVKLPEEKRARNYIVCKGQCSGCRVCWKLSEIGKNVLLHLH